MNRRNPKSKKIDEEAMEQAERHNCKCAALMAGAGKILTDFIGNQMWGNDTTIDVALQLLRQAKKEREYSQDCYKKAVKR